jgi:hypothetical protein
MDLSAVIADEFRRVAFQGSFARRRCRHLHSPAGQALAAACPICAQDGGHWVHLRSCWTCGAVGCCDSSRGRHARSHYQQTGHPIIRSIEPGEDWAWCYVDRAYLSLRRAPAHGSATVDPYVERIRRLSVRVLTEPGSLDVAIRGAAAVGDALPPPLGGYVQKVRNHAYRVRDDDVDALLGAGYSEQQIFELTQAAAFGAGLVRLEAAMAALNQES